VSTSPDNSTGLSWPVPNAKLRNLSRALRSSKPEVYYHLQATAPLRDFKSDPSVAVRTSSATTLPLVTTQPQSADKFSVRHPTPPIQPPNLEEDVFDNIAEKPPQLNLGNSDSDSEPEFVDTVAEDRTLLPTPFGPTAEEDPAEFLRRLETYMEFINHNADAKIIFANAMLVSASADRLQALPDAQKDTYKHLKAAFKEKYIQPSILKFRSAREIFGKK